MKIIQHRINTKDQLALVSPEYGIEIDLRANNNDIVLHHDPFCAGEDFENFLTQYKHAGIMTLLPENPSTWAFRRGMNGSH